MPIRTEALTTRAKLEAILEREMEARIVKPDSAQASILRSEGVQLAYSLRQKTVPTLELGYEEMADWYEEAGLGLPQRRLPDFDGKVLLTARAGTLKGNRRANILALRLTVDRPQHNLTVMNTILFISDCKPIALNVVRNSSGEELKGSQFATDDQIGTFCDVVLIANKKLVREEQEHSQEKLGPDY